MKGDSVSIFKVFGFFSKSICPIICMIVEGYGVHYLNQTSFLKRFWIPNCRANEWCLGGFPPKCCCNDSILACLFSFVLPNKYLPGSIAYFVLLLFCAAILSLTSSGSREDKGRVDPKRTDAIDCRNPPSPIDSVYNSHTLHLTCWISFVNGSLWAAFHF